MLVVVCGNLQCTVQHESTGSAGASVTTSSTGMSSSIKKELFQRCDIEVILRSFGVTEMDDINDVSVIYQSWMSHPLCLQQCMTRHCAMSTKSTESASKCAATTAPQHQLIL